MSSDDVEMHTGAHKKNQPKILSDGCSVSSPAYWQLLAILYKFYQAPDGLIYCWIFQRRGGTCKRGDLSVGG